MASMWNKLGRQNRVYGAVPGVWGCPGVCVVVQDVRRCPGREMLSRRCVVVPAWGAVPCVWRCPGVSGAFLREVLFHECVAVPGRVVLSRACGAV